MPRSGLVVVAALSIRKPEIVGTETKINEASAPATHATKAHAAQASVQMLTPQF